MVVLKKRKMIVFMSIFLALFAGMALAAPGIPNQFWGTVTYNGQPAADGLTVTAKIEGDVVATTTTSNGLYSLIVTNPDGNREGDTVNLFVENINTSESGNFCPGCVTEINLSVTYNPPTPYCGDGSCNNGETCSTCSADCGACASSGGGGGGGGAYTPPVVTTTDDEENETETPTQTTTTPTQTTADTGTPDEEEECIERWICADWSNCEDGLQTRNCIDYNDCGTDDRKPFETRPCSLEDVQNTETSPTGFAFLTILQDKGVLTIIGLILIILIGLGIKKGFIRT